MKIYHVRDSENSTPRGPLELTDIFIASKNFELPETAQVSTDLEVWTPVSDLIANWEKGMKRRDYKQVFGGLALVIGGIVLGVLIAQGTGVSILFLGIVTSGGAMFWRGMRGGTF